MTKSEKEIKAAPSQVLYYVGIGASAGGLEALELFFANMPAKSGLAFIVIQHLSPDYKSLMVELLSKRTDMPVHRAENGMLVEPDAVYLIPPRKQLTIFHGRLILSDTDFSRGINLPIDVFFRSLAEDQAEKAIGIILSGTGSDGVRGIRAIKEAGGMVMVQAKESAKFDGMPSAAISTGLVLVDVVLPPEEMPDKLLSFAKMPYSGPVTDQSDALLTGEDSLTRIFSLLRERTKVDFTLYKPSTVLRRIERRMVVNQSLNLRDYVRFLEARPGEVTTLYRELLIGVTSFFRDREVFDEMETNILPVLLSDEKQRGFRFWVSGCSTGEEAYTLAILVKETMERLKRQFDVKIFATDIDSDAILFAGNGLYPESITADLPAGLLRKYFVPKEEHYQINRNIREMVIFARHDLIKDPPFTNIHLLSCRNLLIYLQPILQRKVIEFLNFSLSPQGILLLGTSETPGDAGEFFEPVHQKYKIYRSRGKKHRTTERLQFKAKFHAYEQHALRPYTRPAYGVSGREDERLLNRILEFLADDFIPLVAIVNSHMELIHLTGDAQTYFRLPSGRQLNDITRMAVKELSIPLATGLQKIFRDGKEIKYTNVRVQDKNGTQVVQLLIRLLPGKKGQDPLAAILIRETPRPQGEKKRGKEQEFDISREAEQRISDLEQDLQFTKESLQATIEELETSNEELQATNEELLASNEELQSTNEELQSVNEELNTVNTEYQSKILEMTEITNDLENLIAATQIATLFLDENLEIRKFTPELTQIFHILQNDVGRPISYLAHKLEDVDLLSAIQDVMKNGSLVEQEVHTNEGMWFLMRILPYAIGGPSASGMVLTFTNIDQLKRVSEELQARDDAARKLSFAIEQSPVSVIITDLQGQIEYVNSHFTMVSGYLPEDVIGQNPRILKSGKVPDNVYKELWETITAGREWKGELLDKRKDGELYWEYATISPIRDDDGNITNYIAIEEDITKRKQAQDELLRFTQLLNATQQLTHVGGWQWDVQKQQMYWTDEVYRIHGMQPDELEPGSPEHIERSLACYTPTDRKIIEEAFRRCTERGEPYDLEFPFTNMKGKRMRIRTTAHAVQEGETIVQVIGSVMEISKPEKEVEKGKKKG
jgi:two-component system CheB/CheR fusion protein